MFRKSSRDVTAVVKEHKQKLRLSQANIRRDSHDDIVNQQKVKPIDVPDNVKAYKLYSEGLTPIQVVSELKLSEAEATSYYMEYLRLKRLPKLASTLEKVKVPRKITLFIQLTNLALAENMRATQVLQLLKLANSRGMYNIEQNIKNYSWSITNLRKTRQEEGLELVALKQRIDSAKGILNQSNIALNEKKEELAAILEKKMKYERMVELFRLNDETFLKIQRVAKDKVNAFLMEYNGRKLLEFALAAVAEVQRQDPLFIQRMPKLKNYDFDPNKLFFPNPYDYSDTNKERAFELSSEIYNKMVKGLIDVAILTAAGLGAPTIS